MSNKKSNLASRYAKSLAVVLAATFSIHIASAAPAPVAPVAADKPDIHTLCATVVIACVFDSHNQFVGTSLASSLVRRINDEAWILNYDANGLLNSIQFYYADTACATVAYIQTGGYVATDGVTIINDLPQRASFDGTNLWGSTAPGIFLAVKSFRSPPMPCQVPFKPFSIVVRPASIIDNTTFFPPFRVE